MLIAEKVSYIGVKLHNVLENVIFAEDIHVKKVSKVCYEGFKIAVLLGLFYVYFNVSIIWWCAPYMNAISTMSVTWLSNMIITYHSIVIITNTKHEIFLSASIHHTAYESLHIYL